MIKPILLLLLLTSSTLPSFCQEKPLSPKETISGQIGDNTIEIVYCRPSARGRNIMGALVAYDEVWRTGANEATTISFSEAAQVEGQEIPEGKYEFFTIPGKNEWTLIFQNYGKQWGAYSYKKANDVLRIKVPSKKTASYVETFTIKIEGHSINLAWENTSVSFSVK